MHPSRLIGSSLLALLFLLGGCATRPINPPITQIDVDTRIPFQNRQKHSRARTTWSSLPSRAAARELPRFPTAFWSSSDGPRSFAERRQGPPARCSRHHHRRVRRKFHGAGLRPVRRQAVRRLRATLPQAQRPGRNRRRAFNPEATGATLSSTGWGRSELAAQLYDEILFNGATFGDLNRGDGPLILASATDISTGSRFVLHPERISTSSARISKRAAVPRRCGIVGRTRGALARHDQQLWRHLQLRRSALGQDRSSTPRTRRDPPRARSAR